MSEKVVGLGDTDQGTVHEKKFQVTQEVWETIIGLIFIMRDVTCIFVTSMVFSYFSGALR